MRKARRVPSLSNVTAVWLEEPLHSGDGVRADSTCAEIAI